ncbi:unnamed protein product [Durusdinium trenchii]|uniref:Uncharacterized protein n=1 Tax=Durusdinium trenchii TaxID=1381693 RepID=A0ABP0HHU6_9DINO
MTYTYQVRRSLANLMFEQCSSRCLFDFDNPKVAYAWIEGNSCWLKTDHCGFRYEQQGALLRKKSFCKDERIRVNEERGKTETASASPRVLGFSCLVTRSLRQSCDGCVPFSGKLSNDFMKQQCGDLLHYPVDISEHARACHFTDTPMVKKALANLMFSQCGAQCLFDYDFPHGRWYGWNAQSHCYEKNPAGCKGTEAQAFAIERKALACKANRRLAGWQGGTSPPCHRLGFGKWIDPSAGRDLKPAAEAPSEPPELAFQDLQEDCTPVQPALSSALMNTYCEGKPSQLSTARACDGAMTVFLQKALANFMFKSCGEASCVFDFDQPDQIVYQWDSSKGCYEAGGAGNPCFGSVDQALAIKKKSKMCQDAGCIHMVPTFSNALMTRYCGDLSRTGEDRSITAQGCEDDTIAVQKSLANHMFSHCGTWCIFDFDDPAISYGWWPEKKCWQRGGCEGHPEGSVAKEVKAKSCELTTTTTTSTSTSTSTITTSTSTTSTSTTTITSTSTTTTSTSTVTSTTTTSTSTITSTTTTSTSTSTTTTSTTTITSTTTTSTSTTTETSTTTTLTTTSTTTITTTTATDHHNDLNEHRDQHYNNLHQHIDLYLDNDHHKHPDFDNHLDINKHHNFHRDLHHDHLHQHHHHNVHCHLNDDHHHHLHHDNYHHADFHHNDHLHHDDHYIHLDVDDQHYIHLHQYHQHKHDYLHQDHHSTASDLRHL